MDEYVFQVWFGPCYIEQKVFGYDDKASAYTCIETMYPNSDTVHLLED